MILCDNCKAEPATRYRVTIGNGMPGEDFAEIDLCATCAKNCFAGVFMFISDFDKGNRVGVKAGPAKGKRNPPQSKG